MLCLIWLSPIQSILKYKKLSKFFRKYLSEPYENLPFLGTCSDYCIEFHTDICLKRLSGKILNYTSAKMVVRTFLLRVLSWVV